MKMVKSRMTHSFVFYRRSALLIFLLFFGFEIDAAPQDFQDRYDKIQSYIVAHPTDPKGRLALADLFAEGLNFSEAVKYYREALSLDDKNLHAIVELCALLTQQREQKSARDMCLRWIEIDPQNYLAYDNMGLFHLKMGEHLEALPWLTRALALKPEASLVKNHIAQVYMALGQYQLARELYEKLIQNETDDETRAYLYHGLWLANKGVKDYPAALEAIKETQRLTGNPLFWGKRISTTMAAHQLFFFFLVSGILLSACWYFGKRLNRFLKNET